MKAPFIWSSHWKKPPAFEFLFLALYKCSHKADLGAFNLSQKNNQPCNLCGICESTFVGLREKNIFDFSWSVWVQHLEFNDRERGNSMRGCVKVRRDWHEDSSSAARQSPCPDVVCQPQSQWACKTNTALCLMEPAGAQHTRFCCSTCSGGRSSTLCFPGHMR